MSCPHVSGGGGVLRRERCGWWWAIGVAIYGWCVLIWVRGSLLRMCERGSTIVDGRESLEWSWKQEVMWDLVRGWPQAHVWWVPPVSHPSRQRISRLRWTLSIGVLRIGSIHSLYGGLARTKGERRLKQQIKHRTNFLFGPPVVASGGKVLSSWQPLHRVRSRRRMAWVVFHGVSSKTHHQWLQGECPRAPGVLMGP
jgi:hypothetical protein